MDLFDITVVGGGPTGLFATFYAGMRELRTKLIEALPQLGGQLAVLYPEKYIYDVAGYPKILARDLAKQLAEQAQRFGPEVILDEKAMSLKRDGDGVFILGTDKGEHYSRTVLVSAGVGAFSPNRLGIPDEERYEGKGLSYFVRDLASYKGKRVLVVGGGDSAVDWALTLRAWAKEVLLIHRRDVFRAHERSVTELFSSDVGVRLFHELKEIKGDERVEEAVIVNSKTGERIALNVDAIIASLGFRADLGQVKGWGLSFDESGRHVKVNQRMETSIRGVYAAGDIVSQEGMEKLNLIVTGFAQAAIAVNYAKKYVDPQASVYPGHSSDTKM